MKVLYVEAVLDRIVLLPPEVQDSLENLLEEFEADPVGMSRRTTEYYGDDGMLCRRFIPVSDGHLFFTLKWRWQRSKDESQIIVYAIGPDAHWDGDDRIAIDLP